MTKILCLLSEKNVLRKRGFRFNNNYVDVQITDNTFTYRDILRRISIPKFKRKSLQYRYRWTITNSLTIGFFVRNPAKSRWLKTIVRNSFWRYYSITVITCFANGCKSNVYYTRSGLVYVVFSFKTTFYANIRTSASALKRRYCLREKKNHRRNRNDNSLRRHFSRSTINLDKTQNTNTYER